MSPQTSQKPVFLYTRGKCTRNLLATDAADNGKPEPAVKTTRSSHPCLTTSCVHRSKVTGLHFCGGPVKDNVYKANLAAAVMATLWQGMIDDGSGLFHSLGAKPVVPTSPTRRCAGNTETDILSLNGHSWKVVIRNRFVEHGEQSAPKTKTKKHTCVLE